MQRFEDVFFDYLVTRGKYSKVPGKPETPSTIAIVHGIPELLREVIGTSGFSLSDFTVRGSAGEPNRAFPYIPWVAIFKNSITKSAQKGYYVVILFSEDLNSFWITLNQGYTAFGDRYVDSSVARIKLEDCARAAVDLLGSPASGFSSGPIDLKSNRDLAKGYQSGSIYAKKYDAGNLPSRVQLEKDIHYLLDAYSRLAAVYPGSLIDLDPLLDNAGIEVASAAISRQIPAEPGTKGKQPPPPRVKVKGQERFVRSAEVVARALAMADSKCALATDKDQHPSFISRRTKKNYVEAHHLVLFSQQAVFANSLDVEENIVALCPNCHRLLHYGSNRERLPSLQKLLGKREAALSERGIDVSLSQLQGMYKVIGADD